MRDDRRVVIDAKTGWWRPHEQEDHLRRVRDAGVLGVSITMTGASARTGEVFSYREILENTLLFRGVIERLGGDARLVLEPEDFDRAREEGAVAVMLDLQDAQPLAEDLGRVDAVWLAGVRQIQITYNRLSPIGAGCADGETAGLSRLGHRLVERLNELGILCDLSHAGRRTTLDAIAASSAPTIFSHTGARAIYDVPRSKTDDEIRALAERGGVICIYAVPFWVRQQAGTVDDVVRHIDHCVQLVGAEHVGIGTDRALCRQSGNMDRQEYLDMLADWTEQEFPRDLFPHVHENLWPPEVEGLEATEDLLALRPHLERLGYPPATIDGILGDNVLRLYREVHAARDGDARDGALQSVFERTYDLTNHRL